MGKLSWSGGGVYLVLSTTTTTRTRATAGCLIQAAKAVGHGNAATLAGAARPKNVQVCLGVGLLTC